MIATIASTIPSGRNRHVATVELPAGFYRVLSGVPKPHDLHLNSALFWNTGEIEWIELLDIAAPSQPYGLARWFTLLIRRGEPCEEACPVCWREPKKLGWRYCFDCGMEIVEEQREKEKNQCG